MDYVRNELKILSTIDHPNIIFLYEIIDVEEKDEIYLVTKYFSKGSVGDEIRQLNKKFDEFNEQCKMDGKPDN